MKKIVFGLIVLVMCSCSSKTWLTSDSDAFLEYDKLNHRWQIIWTWKLAKGRVKQDTIPLRTNDNGFQKVIAPGEGR